MEEKVIKKNINKTEFENKKKDFIKNHINFLDEKMIKKNINKNKKGEVVNEIIETKFEIKERQEIKNFVPLEKKECIKGNHGYGKIIETELDFEIIKRGEMKKKEFLEGGLGYGEIIETKVDCVFEKREEKKIGINSYIPLKKEFIEDEIGNGNIIETKVDFEIEKRGELKKKAFIEEGLVYGEIIETKVNCVFEKRVEKKIGINSYIPLKKEVHIKNHIDFLQNKVIKKQINKNKKVEIENKNKKEFRKNHIDFLGEKVIKKNINGNNLEINKNKKEPIKNTKDLLLREETAYVYMNRITTNSIDYLLNYKFKEKNEKQDDNTFDSFFPVNKNIVHIENKEENNEKSVFGKANENIFNEDRQRRSSLNSQDVISSKKISRKNSRKANKLRKIENNKQSENIFEFENENNKQSENIFEFENENENKNFQNENIHFQNDVEEIENFFLDGKKEKSFRAENFVKKESESGESHYFEKLGEIENFEEPAKNRRKTLQIEYINVEEAMELKEKTFTNKLSVTKKNSLIFNDNSQFDSIPKNSEFFEFSKEIINEKSRVSNSEEFIDIHENSRESDDEDVDDDEFSF